MATQLLTVGTTSTPMEHKAVVLAATALISHHSTVLRTGQVLGRAVKYAIGQIRLGESVCDEGIEDLMKAMATHLVLTKGDMAMVARGLLPLCGSRIALVAKQAGLALHGALRGFPLSLTKENGERFAERLLTVLSGPCEARPQVLDCVVALADVAGDHPGVLAKAPMLLQVACDLLDCDEDERARAAAAQTMVALCKAFGAAAIRPLAPRILAALDTRRYDRARLVRAAVARAINFYEYVSAGGDLAGAPTPDADVHVPATPQPKVSVSRIAHSRSVDSRVRPGSEDRVRLMMAKRSIFATPPNKAFFRDASPATELRGLTIAELDASTPTLQKRFEEQMGAEEQEDAPVLSEKTSLLVQMQEQQVNMLDALDVFSAKVSGVLETMNARLSALEEAVGLVNKAASDGAAPTPEKPLLVEAADEEQEKLRSIEEALESLDGVTEEEREAGLQTVASLYDCDSDSTLLALLAVIDATKALRALARVRPEGVRLGRELVRRAVNAAASAGTTSAELTTCGVRWAATALDVDAGGGTDTAMGLWWEAQTSYDFAVVKKSLQVCAARPGSGGFEAARVFGRMVV